MKLNNFATDLISEYTRSTTSQPFLNVLLGALASLFVGVEHTLFVKKKKGWALLRSTIADPDQIQYITKLVNEELNNVDDHHYYFPNVRPSVSSHLICQLKVSNEIVGLWVMESDKNFFPYYKVVEIEQVSETVAVFIYSYYCEKMMEINLYLDSGTLLPDRVYFKKIINSLIKDQKKRFVGLIRCEEARKSIAHYGSQQADAYIDKVIGELQSLEHTDLFRLYYDTFAVLSDETIDLCAKMQRFVSKFSESKVIIFTPKSEDIMGEIESLFVGYPAGCVHVYSEAKTEITDIFSRDGI